MQNNTKEFVVGEVAHAIQRGCSVAAVETSKGVYVTYIDLPNPQTSGTGKQQSDYAQMRARQIVESGKVKF